MASFPRGGFNEHPPQSPWVRLALWVLLGAWAAAFLAHADRLDLDLSGAWQYQKVAQIAYPPPAAWGATTVPGYLSTTNYEHAWFRKTFDLPAIAAGNRVRLHFGGVKFASQVWVNGTPVGGYLNGYEPFELDITAAARAGTNELLVALTDWTATFSYHVDFSNLAPYENPRDHATNALLAPIGGRYDLYGVWQPVHVLSVPAVAIADVRPSATARRARDAAQRHGGTPDGGDAQPGARRRHRGPRFPGADSHARGRRQPGDRNRGAVGQSAPVEPPRSVPLLSSDHPGQRGGGGRGHEPLRFP
jgi:hypothetical protein